MAVPLAQWPPEIAKIAVDLRSYFENIQFAPAFEFGGLHEAIVAYRHYRERRSGDTRGYKCGFRAIAVRDDAGRIVQLVGVSSDITARKFADIDREALVQTLASEREALSKLTCELEDRVKDRTSALLAEIAVREKAQEQLLQSQKLESIGKLTGGVAHDFNNLLMAVVGNLDLLRKRVPDDPRIIRLIDGALQGAQRGASLTQRMLAFARQQDLITTSADMMLLLVGLRDLIERSLGPRFQLVIMAHEDLPPAQIDANQVELAILNLAINARDAMPNGGTIRIEGRLGSKPDSQTKSVIISVIDNGLGMDPETLKKATEPFFSTKPLGKGTGLGLSMVHGLAVQLGGHLELQSNVGNGTTAELWLPIAKESAILDAPTIEITQTDKKVKVLVVDDDALISMSTVDMLEDLGHVVLEASSGVRALEIFKSETDIDLVITDQIMPGMTGTQLAEKLRELQPSLPILLATGYTDLPEGMKSDLPRLPKPYRQSELQKQISQLI